MWCIPPRKCTPLIISPVLFFGKKLVTVVDVLVVEIRVETKKMFVWEVAMSFSHVFCVIGLEPK
jgi:hypothetical protein